MKKHLFHLIFLLLPVTFFAQQSALYVEFTGSGIPHKGIILINEQTRQGVFKVAIPSQNGIMVIEQLAQLSLLQVPNVYAFGQSGWQMSQQNQTQGSNQDFVIMCNTPRIASTGQMAPGYQPDTFVFQNGQLTVRSNGQATRVNARPIQSQQEYLAIAQQLGLIQSTQPTTAPVPNPSSQAPPVFPTNVPNMPSPQTNPAPGPQYPTNTPGGLGNPYRY
ncbi:MAG: hypothetical protein ACE362_21665 [Phaeodactylibacter xiamenensis]|jgi:hypothetical protein|uniref:DUF4412 domain-containing protein n=2 Tax=Phaeodactylibacter xiamenensis TaxID=1524460 RepID=A0A098S3T4_9BACT|nr:hypothetical protein [Phaeodactylibacter xiamenensis]KGE86488.1 hypothetical protein IX84_22210 [Phaeodactylibacter xiamenensis]MCR9054192.1 hypothetical protein [bacterium]